MALPLYQDLTLPNGLKYQQPLGLFIDNQFVGAKNGGTLETINPTTEEPIATVHAGDADDVNVAVQAARRAFKTSWKHMPGAERASLMRTLAILVKENSDTLAAVEAADTGKPMHTNVSNDMNQLIAILNFYAGIAETVQGQTIPISADKLAYTIREPYGVCGQIIPWNYPLGMAGWKLAPALATGNCIVIKSAEQTPLSLLCFCQLVQKAGFPPGVFNVITGLGSKVGPALTGHPDVDKVAFTGSTSTGKAVMKSAAETLKAVTLECGGKSPNLVFDDCDFEQAVKWSSLGILYNMGQNCTATSRIYVQDTIYDKFLQAFVAEQAKTAVGDPFDKNVTHGPQITKQHQEKILEYIKKGKEEGARLILGGSKPKHTSKGYFVEPTVFADVKEDMTIVREEIFGPVVSIGKFSTEEEALRLANNSCYGLGSAVFTKDLSRAHRVAAALEAGMVWVNSSQDEDVRIPFGGYKQSGIGSELGDHGVEAYTQTKSVHLNLGVRL